jgi:hypothetical protein
MSKWFRHLAVTTLMSVSLVSTSFADDAKAPPAKAQRVAIVHGIAMQADRNDLAVVDRALNNAIDHYRANHAVQGQSYPQPAYLCTCTRCIACQWSYVMGEIE